MRKKIYIQLFLGSLLSFLLSSVTVNAQCDDEDFMDKCAASLGNYTFLKAYNVALDKGKKQEVSYVFSKDHSYIISVCDGGDASKGKLIVNLYDRNKKLVGSSFVKSGKKHFPKIGYDCTATGVYYIETVFEDDKGGCGVAILGFKQ